MQGRLLLLKVTRIKGPGGRIFPVQQAALGCWASWGAYPDNNLLASYIYKPFLVSYLHPFPFPCWISEPCVNSLFFTFSLLLPL